MSHFTRDEISEISVLLLYVAADSAQVMLFQLGHIPSQTATTRGHGTSVPSFGHFHRHWTVIDRGLG